MQLDLTRDAAVSQGLMPTAPFVPRPAYVLPMPDEADLVEAWFTAFHGDADEQAGRPAREHEGHVERDDIVHRIETVGSGCGRTPTGGSST